MNNMERNAIIAYHRNRLTSEPHYAQGWLTHENQQARFEMISRIGDFSNSSVLDCGCGIGDFAEFLDRKWTNVSYSGIEIVSEFVYEFQHRFRGDLKKRVVQADFLSGNLPEADYIVASGSLNYIIDNEQHPYSIIESMWKSSRKGVAFNLLNSQTFKAGNTLCGYDPEQIVKFCKKLTDSVTLINGYLPHDFTVHLRQ